MWAFQELFRPEIDYLFLAKVVRCTCCHRCARTWSNICYLTGIPNLCCLIKMKILSTNPSFFMKTRIQHLAKSPFNLILFTAMLLSLVSLAQDKKASKPAKGYGEASYTLSTSEQYMSAWLVAGPVRLD